MHLKQIRFLLLALLASLGSATFIGCGGERSDPHTQGQSIPAGSGPALDQNGAASWEALLGVRLRSVQTHPGGLGPDGQLWEHQYLQLNEDGSFEWLKADMTLSGTYRREGDRVLGNARGRDFIGKLDLERSVLIWNGIEFDLP